jgi:hypothetical protein
MYICGKRGSLWEARWQLGRLWAVGMCRLLLLLLRCKHEGLAECVKCSIRATSFIIIHHYDYDTLDWILLWRR